MSVKIQVFGIKETQARLMNVAIGVTTAINQTIIQTASKITEDAKYLAPFRTGNLMRSIQWFLLGPNSAIVMANANGLAPYATYVEFGTYKMAAQPFMRPAALGGEDYALAMARQNILRELKMSNRNTGFSIEQFYGFAESQYALETFEGFNPEHGEEFKNLEIKTPEEL